MTITQYSDHHMPCPSSLTLLARKWFQEVCIESSEQNSNPQVMEVTHHRSLQVKSKCALDTHQSLKGSLTKDRHTHQQQPTCLSQSLQLRPCSTQNNQTTSINMLFSRNS